MYENGIQDYVAHINKVKRAEIVNDEIIWFEQEKEDKSISLEVAMQWTSAYTESVHTYANT